MDTVLLSALEGSGFEANRSRSAGHVHAVVRSHSTPCTAAECWPDWLRSRCGVPHGEETKVTYHLGPLSRRWLIPAWQRTSGTPTRDCWESFVSMAAQLKPRNRFAAPMLSLVTGSL